MTDPTRGSGRAITLVLISVLAVAAVGAGPSFAQPPRPPGTQQGDPLRDETFRLMDAYLISNLQESLDLTDDQFARTLPLVKRLLSDRREFARRRMMSLRDLRKTLRAGGATEATIAEGLKEVKSAGADERAATVKNMEALDAALTPLQQAKYRVFEAEVDTRLRQLRARSQERGRPQPNVR